MNKHIVITAAVMAFAMMTGSAAEAAKTGAYVGLGLGPSRLNTPSTLITSWPSNLTVVEDSQIGGLGGQIFGGYNFNQYVGLEAGLLQYGQSKYNVRVSNGLAGADLVVKYNMQAARLVGKAYLPIANSGFDIYGLGGVALVRLKSQADVSSSSSLLGSHRSETTTGVVPTVGAGVSYSIPQTALSTSLEYSYLQGKGNAHSDNNYLPSAGMVSLNLAYNFG